MLSLPNETVRYIRQMAPSSVRSCTRRLSITTSDIGDQSYIHRVSKNVPPVDCYNVDAHEWILMFSGRNVTDKVGSQKTLYYATSNNLCFCTTCQNGETRKSPNAPVRCLRERKIVICDVFDNV